MRQMSTQLRHQNEESQALYKEASEDLNEYISLLNNMKTMMHDIDSKLIDIKKRSVSEWAIYICTYRIYMVYHLEK